MVNFLGVKEPTKKSPVGVGTFLDCEGLRNVADTKEPCGCGYFPGV